MSTPLIDVDANLRQPGFKPTKEGSKIPSPPKFQRAGSIDRCNPFSAIVSPTLTSKLPRKSASTQSEFSKTFTYGSRPTTPRTGLPRVRNWQKPAAIVVLPSSNSIRTTSPLSCNKPLPSPPIAQFVNPASPPKAQRTLVDAEAGTPTEEDWPVLQPENVPPSKSPAPSTNDKVLQRSVSEGSVFRCNGIPTLKSRVTTPLLANNRTPSRIIDSLTEDEDLGNQRFRQMTEPRELSPMSPHAKSFHAFSTNANVAMESPLTHQQQALSAMVIPPRISSKRSSLPLPGTATNALPTQPSVSLRPVKPGCTKWPILVAAEQRAKKEAINEVFETGQYSTAEPDRVESAPFDGAIAIQSHYGSIDSVSTWNLAAGSSLDDEAEVNYKGTVRVKRISWHSSNPESGPILRISADADAILLGRDDFIPAVPALPEYMLRQPSQERSFNTLPGRVTKQVLANTVPIAGARTPTPSSTKTEIIESKLVKITPIRSMQPPRKSSTGDLSQKCPSLGTLAPTEAIKNQEVLDSTQANSRGSFEASRVSQTVQTKSDASHLMSEECPKNGYVAGNYSTTFQNEAPQKAMQVLGTDTDASELTTRKRLPMTWMTPKSATCTLKKSDATCSKTSLSLRSTERVNDRASAASTRSLSSASSSLTHPTPLQAGARQLGPSRLGVTESLTRGLDLTLCENSSKDGHFSDQTAADKALRMRAKRSFRNIFGRRKPKATPHPAKIHDSKRSSVAGSALAQRIRTSTNFSKVSLARPPETKPESNQDTVISSDSFEALDKETTPQAALSALEFGSAETSTQPAPTAQYDTATVIHRILSHVTSMRKDSPDRLRGLEIAEAVLHAVECTKEANLSAELARKHAYDAELNAERVGIQLKRLEKLCEPGFNDETMQAVKQLVVAAGIVEFSVATED